MKFTEKHPYFLKYKKILMPLYLFVKGILRLQYSSKGIGVLHRVPLLAKPFSKYSFAQQGEDLVLDRILFHILKIDPHIPHTYVDIGAYHPINQSVTYLLYLRGWKGVAVDLSESTRQSFAKSRPRDIFFNVAVGSDDQNVVEVYKKTNLAGDSHPHNTKYPDNASNYSVDHISQKSINSILKESRFQTVTFLNLDVEGAELEILEALDFDQYDPAVIAVEIHGNKVEECLTSDIAKLLRSKGYICVASSVITFFFIKEQYL